jgi:ATP-dependent DNA helicase RecG
VNYKGEYHFRSGSTKQELNDVSRRTATRDLIELVEVFKIVLQAGNQGAGSYYELIAP